MRLARNVMTVPLPEPTSRQNVGLQSLHVGSRMRINTRAKVENATPKLRTLWTLGSPRRSLMHPSVGTCLLQVRTPSHSRCYSGERDTESERTFPRTFRHLRAAYGCALTSRNGHVRLQRSSRCVRRSLQRTSAFSL